MIPTLHRTYPLCVCCKLDPYIAACERDPNINVISGSTVESISGDLGDFTDSFTSEVQPHGAVMLKIGKPDKQDFNPLH